LYLKGSSEIAEVKLLAVLILISFSSAKVEASGNSVGQFPNDETLFNSLKDKLCAVVHTIRNSATPHSATKIADTIQIRMSPFQGLRQSLSAFVEDPLVPKHLKALVRKTLSENDVDIIKLTDDLRREYLIPDYLDALASKKELKYNYIDRPTEKSTNMQATDLMNGVTADSRKPYPFKMNNSVMVQDRGLNREHNDLITLIHELAHIRMRRYMEANINKLAKRFPGDLISGPGENGDYGIDEQLINYLDERFAHEMEFQALRATYLRYYQELPQKWSPNTLAASDNDIRAAISDYICFVYQITDPRITSLRSKKISEILIGGITR
jgi:hypothetical protein